MEAKFYQIEEKIKSLKNKVKEISNQILSFGLTCGKIERFDREV